MTQMRPINADFFIVGDAVAFYRHPRYTKDIDIWIDRIEENAVK
jgi:hypothetical protein